MVQTTRLLAFLDFSNFALMAIQQTDLLLLTGVLVPIILDKATHCLTSLISYRVKWLYTHIREMFSLISPTIARQHINYLNGLKDAVVMLGIHLSELMMPGVL